MLTLFVDKKNPDYFPTIQEALNAVPYNETAVIHIGEGLFNEKLFADKKDITLIGKGPDKTIITNSDYGYRPYLNGLKLGTFRSYTAFFSGEKLTLKSLAIRNDSGYGKDIGQAVALYIDTEFAICEDLHLFGHQDTLFIAPLPKEEREKYGFNGPRCKSERKMCNAIFRNSVIEGNVDYIFGGGNALFESCSINSLSSGYVCAPCESDKGFVFNKCNFKASKGSDVYLMRSWRDGAKASFIESLISDEYNALGALKWNEKEQNLIRVYSLNRSFKFSKELTAVEADNLIASFS